MSKYLDEQRRKADNRRKVAEVKLARKKAIEAEKKLRKANKRK